MAKSKKAYKKRTLKKYSFKNKKGGSCSMSGNVQPNNCFGGSPPLLKTEVEPKLSTDCMNPKGISQLGLVPTNLPETVSEQAFANRYNWSGDSVLAGAETTSGLSSNNHLKTLEQTGGKRKNKNCKGKNCNKKSKEKKSKKNNKQSSSKKSHRHKKKTGGGYYLSLEQPKIAGQAVVSGYENCISDPKF